MDEVEGLKSALNAHLDDAEYSDLGAWIQDPQGFLAERGLDRFVERIETVKFVLFAYRFLLSNAPGDASRATRLALDSDCMPNDTDKSEFSGTIFFLATSNTTLFEEFSDLRYLEDAMDLFKMGLSVPGIGDMSRLELSGLQMSTLILYYLKSGALEPLDEASKIFEQVVSSDPLLPHVPQKSRHLLVHAYILRDRFFVDASEDRALIRDLVSKILCLFPCQKPFHYCIGEIFIISLLLYIAKDFDSTDFIASLQCLFDFLGQGVPLSASSADLAASLLSAIDACPATITTSATCLLYQADSFDARASRVEPAELYGQVEDDLERWDEEWRKARGHFEIADDGKAASFFLSDLNIFKLYAPPCVEKSSGAGRIRFREEADPHVHKCLLEFRVQMVRVGTECEVLSRDDFMRDLESKCSDLGDQELGQCVKDLDSFVIPHHDTIPPEWIDFDCIKACLLFVRYQKYSRKDYLHEAGNLLLTYHPSENSTYVSLLYRVACELAGDFGQGDNLATAITLHTAILRTTKPTTVKHFVVVMALSLAMVREWKQTRDTRRFVGAMELFREAVAARGGLNWRTKARTVVVAGWIMGLRWRYYGDSDECNEQTITMLESMLHIISPWTTVTWTSTLETLVVSIMIYLSKNLRQKSWISSLQLLDHFLRSLLNTEQNANHRDPSNTSSDEEALQSIDTHGTSLCGALMAYGTLDLLYMADILTVASEKLFNGPHEMLIPIRNVEDRLTASLDENGLSLAPAQGSEFHFSALSNSWSSTIQSFRDHFNRFVATGVTLEPTNSPVQIYFGYRPITPSDARRGGSGDPRIKYEIIVIQGHIPDSLTPSPSSSSATTPAISSIETWPPLVFEERGNRSLPSNATMPWMDDAATDENHPLANVFDLPLHARTQKAFTQYIWSQSRLDAHTTASVFQKAINLTSEWHVLDPTQLPLEAQLKTLKDSSQTYASEGPLFILLSLGPEKCLEAVDASRTLFWNRLLRLKVAFDGVPQPLRQRLEEAAEALGHHVYSAAIQDAGKLVPDPSESMRGLREHYDSERAFTRLVSEVRELPGFEDFLMPHSHEKLLLAAKEGPVVVIVGSRDIHTALIIRPQGVEALWLSKVTKQMIASWVNALNQDIQMARSMIDEDTDRALKPWGTRKQHSSASRFQAALSGMWNYVVQPIMAHLGFTPISDIEKRPRLWWCPTGQMTLLPIHAAGTGNGTTNVVRTSDYVLSSYVPTPGTLANAYMSDVADRNPLKSSDLTVLALAQPTTYGLQSLPSTVAELDTIEEIFPSSQILRIGADSNPPSNIPKAKKLSSTNSNKTVDEAMSNLHHASILHLACHGQQNQKQPLQSGFRLEDGRLTLSKLISCHMPRAFVAFLSACESASSDVTMPDESLSLATAMLYAGFPSAIGTMWTMNDSDGPQIARIFYQELFSRADYLDGRRVSISLHKATRTLEDRGIHTSRWATYIHVGV